MICIYEYHLAKTFQYSFERVLSTYPASFYQPPTSTMKRVTKFLFPAGIDVTSAQESNVFRLRR